MNRTRTLPHVPSSLPLLHGRAFVIAWIWAFILPIEVVTGIPSGAIDVARWAGFGVVVLAFRPDASAALRDRALRWGMLLGALALLQLGAALLHGDELKPGLLMVASVVAAGLVALRTGSHRPILYGYLAGCTLSATVTIMQMAELPTLASGNIDDSRFPGLATTTVILTWQLAFAILIAVYLVATAERGSLVRRAAAASTVILTIGLVGCGTQGGLLALLIAGGCYSARAWRRGSLGPTVRYGLIAVVAVAAFVVVSSHLGLSATTIEEFGPGNGYENERARVDLAVEGVKAIGEQPLTGPGIRSFKDANLLVPHFLPIYMGVAAGLVGLALGSWVLIRLIGVVIRGPLSNHPYTVLGWTLTAAMFANTLTEPVGPFTGLSKLPLFAIALVACNNLAAASAHDPIEELS